MAKRDATEAGAEPRTGRPWWSPAWVPTPVVDALGGRMRLWIVFWGCGLAGFALIGIVAMLLPWLFHTVGGALAAALALILVIVWSQSVWRCAFNVRWRVWGYAARAAVLGMWFYLLTLNMF